MSGQSVIRFGGEAGFLVPGMLGRCSNVSLPWRRRSLPPSFLPPIARELSLLFTDYKTPKVVSTYAIYRGEGLGGVMMLFTSFCRESRDGAGSREWAGMFAEGTCGRARTRFSPDWRRLRRPTLGSGSVGRRGCLPRVARGPMAAFLVADMRRRRKPTCDRNHHVAHSTYTY